VKIFLKVIHGLVSAELANYLVLASVPSLSGFFNYFLLGNRAI